jgi:hypothetical protein
LLQTSGLREAYLKRRVAVQQFKFVDPLVADLYITDAKPFDHIILDKNDITFSQVINPSTFFLFRGGGGVVIMSVTNPFSFFMTFIVL